MTSAGRTQRRSDVARWPRALAAVPLVVNVAQAQPVSAADTPDAELELLTKGNERYERYVENSRANGIFLLDAQAALVVRLHSQQF
jgi:hypothetical protein